MLRIDSIDEGIPIYYALASEIRMKIISLLAKNKSMNMNELSTQLSIPSSTLTAHIRQLDLCGLVEVTAAEGVRGTQKICSLKENRLIIELTDSPAKRNLKRFELPIGSYSNYAMLAPCGIATTQSIIGELNKPCYFDSPERFSSGVLWLSSGFVEYPIPNYFNKNTVVSEIQISMEIASDLPLSTISDKPLGVTFSFNQVSVGSWVIPRDAENMQSLYTPAWWNENWIQSSKIKLLTINSKGTFIDGNNLVSNITIDQLDIQAGQRLIFRIAAEAGGGLTLFGRGFGRYNQDIYVRISYTENS